MDKKRCSKYAPRTYLMRPMHGPHATKVSVLQQIYPEIYLNIFSVSRQRWLIRSGAGFGSVLRLRTCYVAFCSWQWGLEIGNVGACSISPTGRRLEDSRASEPYSRCCSIFVEINFPPQTISAIPTILSLGTMNYL